MLGSLGTAVYRHRLELPSGLPQAAEQAARDTLVGADAAARQLGGEAGEAMLAAARAAFTGGLHVVALVSAVLLAGVAVLIAGLLRHVPPTGQAVAEEPEPELESA